MTALPTTRRHAVQFRYGDIPRDLSMENLGCFAKPHAETKMNTLRGNVYNEPSDSWEIELCVGFAIEKIIEPHRPQVKSLGRSLGIFKVHKDPPVCELFFMPREEVIKTYKGSNQKTLEWVHMYNPESEFVFWAELFKPSPKGGRRSLLTDELCGAFGSRCCLVREVRDENVFEKIKRAVEVTSSREQCEEAAAKSKAQIERNRRKKDRQREKKAVQKAHVQLEEERLLAEMEAQKVAAMRAARIPAPHLQGVNFASLMSAKIALEMSEMSDASEDEEVIA